MNGPEIYATVFALVPSNYDENTLWAGSDDGLVHLTRDHGKSWKNITPPDMPKDTRISIIEESKHKPGTIYIAAKRYQMDDRKPYLWKTHDYGQSWSKITKGIRKDDFLHVIREDLNVSGLLYAGGEHEVWVSYNDGENWESLSLNLPDTQISDLIVTEKDLVIGTHGRSIYVLDDISPIREMSKVDKEKPYLYNVYFATRRVQDAEIKYYLPSKPQNLSIKIIDNKNRVVLEKKGLIDSNTDKNEASSWFGADNKNPTMNIGLNNYNWNLRYPGATDFEGMIIWSAKPTLGPIAPPGKYKVQLTIDNQLFETSLEVRKDPRIKVSDDVINKQFDFAMNIMMQTDLANRSVIEIREIKEKLNKIFPIKSSSKSKKLKSLISDLEKIESSIYQVKNQSGQDPLNFPIKVNNRLAYLRKSVESGDGLPSVGAKKVFKMLKQELSVYVSELNKLKNKAKKFL